MRNLSWAGGGEGNGRFLTVNVLTIQIILAKIHIDYMKFTRAIPRNVVWTNGSYEYEQKMADGCISNASVGNAVLIVASVGNAVLIVEGKRSRPTYRRHTAYYALAYYEDIRRWRSTYS